MKLIIVSAGNFFSDYGGGQVYVKHLVDALVKHGISPVIATPCGVSTSVEHYRGCQVYSFSGSWSTVQNTEVTAFLRNIKPDLVHAHGAKKVFAEACHASGVPIVITAHHGGILCPAGTLLNHHDRICVVRANHDVCLPCVLRNIRGGTISWWFVKMIPLEVRLRIGRHLRKRTFIPYLTPIGTASLSIEGKNDDWKTIAKYSSLLVAPSKAMAESMIRNGAAEHKVKIVTHGIVLPDSKEVLKIGNNVHAPEECMRFFYVGRISYVKGLHVLLKAFACITGNVELHLIGGTGNKQEERYMRYLKRKFISDKRIIWHGKVVKEKVNQLIATLDVMVHPAIYLEVFGLTIAEALALGKPVIATRCGGAEEQIKNEVNGLFVKPNDYADLRSAMQRFLDNRYLLGKMGKNGPGSVNSMTKHTKELIGLYRDLLITV